MEQSISEMPFLLWSPRSAAVPPYPWFCCPWFQLPAVSQQNSTCSSSWHSVITSVTACGTLRRNPGVIVLASGHPKPYYLTASQEEGWVQYNIVQYFERQRPHSCNFYFIYCYNCSIIISYCCESLTVPHLQIKLSHKCVGIGKNSLFRVRYYPWFQAPRGGLGMYHPGMRWNNCIYISEDVVRTMLPCLKGNLQISI